MGLSTYIGSLQYFWISNLHEYKIIVFIQIKLDTNMHCNENIYYFLNFNIELMCKTTSKT